MSALSLWLKHGCPESYTTVTYNNHTNRTLYNRRIQQTLPVHVAVSNFVTRIDDEHVTYQRHETRVRVMGRVRIMDRVRVELGLGLELRLGIVYEHYYDL